jgi:hypothetical protein
MSDLSRLQIGSAPASITLDPVSVGKPSSSKVTTKGFEIPWAQLTM